MRIHRADGDVTDPADVRWIWTTHRDHAGGLFDLLDAAPDAAPFVGPDQVALEAMLARFEPPAPAIA